MVICFIIIKQMISYELTTLTHTLMIGQLYTYSIDLNVKHAHLNNVKHRLNLSAYRCRCLDVYVDIWISRYFWKVPRMSR